MPHMVIEGSGWRPAWRSHEAERSPRRGIPASRATRRSRPSRGVPSRLCPVEAVRVEGGVMDEELPASTVSLHGHQVHYVRAGTGPVLVLLHGVLGNRQ